MPTFPIDYLREVSTKLFKQSNVPSDLAKRVSECIIENCLYGHDSHGVCLLPKFLTELENGQVDPKSRIEVVRKSPCTALIDAQRGFGMVTTVEAMQMAMDTAKKMGVSALSVTNSNHIGMLWNYAKMPAEEGLIGMLWCVSGESGGGGLVAPFGGKKSAIGTNPIGVGIPAGQMKPLVLDISTSAVAASKVVMSAQQGKRIPLGWILDKNGSPTTNPNDLGTSGNFFGSLLPMAGHKGYGLGLIAEILGGIVTGHGASHMSTFKEGQGIFIVVVNVAAFIPLEEFKKEMDAFLEYVKSTPSDSETEEILIPGELEYRTREQRERDGSIPVTDAVWTKISLWAEKLGVEL